MGEDYGADFSTDRKYRYALWRIWDRTNPLAMFIGLNPSKADEAQDDPTIKSVVRICKSNGYGDFYMMNCWAYVSTDPKKLIYSSEWIENYNRLLETSKKCKDVVFAWGNFSIVKEQGVDTYLQALFPNAKMIGLNKNGSPKHPLFQKGSSVLIDFETK